MTPNLNVAIEQIGKQLDETRDERDRLRALLEEALACVTLPMASPFRIEWARDARAILAEIPESPTRVVHGVDIPLVAIGAQLNALPLLFTHRGTILGNGFLAEIEFLGRVLATLEVDGVWIDGVNPGAIAVGAKTLAETKAELDTALAQVLIGFAEDAADFNEFRTRIERFYNDVDADTAREWHEAVEAVRSGAINGPEGMGRP